jgi:hypothetical protein
MREKVSNRKERSDKKVDVKPTVPIHLYNCIANLADITGQPIKNVVEFICMDGLRSRKVLDFISQYFRRDYQHENTIYRGNPNLAHSRYIVKNVPSKRVSTRFNKEFNESMEVLAFSLGLTSVSSATRLLLECAIRDIDIIDRLIRLYTTNLSELQKKLLRDTLKYLYKNNPFKEQITFIEIVEMLIDEAREWSILGLRKNV